MALTTKTSCNMATVHNGTSNAPYRHRVRYAAGLTDYIILTCSFVSVSNTWQSSRMSRQTCHKCPVLGRSYLPCSTRYKSYVSVTQRYSTLTKKIRKIYNKKLQKLEHTTTRYQSIFNLQIYACFRKYLSQKNQIPEHY